MSRLLLLLALAAPLMAEPLAAQCAAGESRYCAEVSRLVRDARVARALASIEPGRERARRDLVELTQIPAPPFAEEARGRRFAEMLRQSGADSVWVDSVGNVLGLRRGVRRDRTVVIEGHLDTVFPEGTDVTVRVRGDTLLAPGIGDDTRGLVAVLEALRALEHADVPTGADLLFVGTVGEEGLGDLRGVKHLFRPGAAPRIDAYISVEPGEENRLTTAGIGSRRYRVAFRGPGGHSWGAFGTANPIHALGRAIAHFDAAADSATRSGPRTTYNVGRVGGGTSVNSVPFEAWMEVDIRSVDPAAMVGVDTLLQAAARRALEEQNAVARTGEPLAAELSLIGDRPSGAADPRAPLLQRARAVVSHFGREPVESAGSTNANIPFALGVPAVTIGHGAEVGDAHALTEWMVERRGHLAVRNAVLLLLAEAGLGR